MIHSRRLVLFFFAVVAAIATAKSGDPDYLELRRMIGREQFPEALERCKELLVVHPDDVALYETLAEVAQYAGNLDEAIGFFTRNIEQGNRPGLCHFGLGTVAYYTNDFQSAVLELTKAIECGVEAPECYKEFEYAYERLHGVDSAIRLLTSLCHRSDQNGNYAYALSLAYWSKRDYTGAISQIRIALARRNSEPEFKEAEVAILLLLGKCNNEQFLLQQLISNASARGDYASSLFLRSCWVGRNIVSGRESENNLDLWSMIDEAQEYGFFRWLGWGYERIADFDFFAGDYDQALKYLAKAKQAALNMKDGELVEAATSREIRCYEEMGRFKESLTCAYARLKSAQLRIDDFSIANSINELASIYNEIGVNDIAQEYAIEALSRTERMGAHDGLMAQIETTLGLINETKGNYPNAMRYFKSAYDRLSITPGHDRPLAIINGNIGHVYLRIEKYNSALRYFEQQLRLARVTSYKREEAYALCYLGELYAKMGNAKVARRYYEEAHGLSQRILQRRVVLLTSRGLGRISEVEGNLQEAVRWYRSAIVTSEALAASAISTLDGTDNNGPLRDDYRNMVRVLVASGREQEAFNWWEISQMRRFSHEGEFAVSRVAKFLPEWFKQEYSEAQFEIMARRLRIADQLSRRSLGIRQDSIVQLLGEIASREVQCHQTIDSLCEMDGTLKGLLHPEAVPIWKLQSSLGEDQALLEFVVLEDETICFVISSRDFSVWKSPVGREELRKQLSALSPIFSADERRQGAWNAILSNFDVRAAQDLHHSLLEPALPYLKGKRSLLIVPDDVLRAMPFELLVNGDSSTTKWKSTTVENENFAISYLYAGSHVCNNGWDDSGADKQLLLFANENPSSNWTRESEFVYHKASSDEGNASKTFQLLGVKEEVTRIQSAFSGNSDIFTGTMASKQNLSSRIGRYRMVHIAAHSTFDAERPMYSSVFLSSADNHEDDGRLYAFELMTFNWKADLVVLSSCYSAGGPHGQGMEGLVKAVALSGVPSVVASLWAVDDATTISLMEKFYRHVSLGETKSVALQNAKRELMISGKSDPFYWAGFILVGSTGQPQVKIERTVWDRWLIVGFTLITVSMVLVICLRFLLERRAFR